MRSLAGAGIGLAEPAESTLVAQLLPDRLRGQWLRAAGWTPVGRRLPVLDDRGPAVCGGYPTVALAYAAAWMVLAVAATVWLRHREVRVAS